MIHLAMNYWQYLVNKKFECYVLLFFSRRFIQSDHNNTAFLKQSVRLLDHNCLAIIEIWLFLASLDNQSVRLFNHNCLAIIQIWFFFGYTLDKQSIIYDHDFLVCESLRIVMLSLGSIDIALILQFFQAMETSRIDQYLLWRFVYMY